MSLRSGPVSRDLDFYYHPHVTVAHEIEDEALDLAFDVGGEHGGVKLNDHGDVDHAPRRAVVDARLKRPARAA